jgi:hypothetical protein
MHSVFFPLLHPPCGYAAGHHFQIRTRDRARHSSSLASGGRRSQDTAVIHCPFAGGGAGAPRGLPVADTRRGRPVPEDANGGTPLRRSATWPYTLASVMLSPKKPTRSPSLMKQQGTGAHARSSIQGGMAASRWFQVCWSDRRAAVGPVTPGLRTFLPLAAPISLPATHGGCRLAA